MSKAVVGKSYCTLYGNENWVLNRIQQNKLDIWEKITQRRIYEERKEHYWWERRWITNNVLHNEATITSIIRTKKLESRYDGSEQGRYSQQNSRREGKERESSRRKQRYKIFLKVWLHTEWVFVMERLNYF